MIQGLAIRIARGLNKVMGAKGRVFRERYHSRLLRSPTDVRRTLTYVLHNGRKHLLSLGASSHPVGPTTSTAPAPWFTGWATARPPPPDERLIARARTWLLTRGWIERGGGPIRCDEVPRT